MSTFLSFVGIIFLLLLLLAVYSCLVVAGQADEWLEQQELERNQAKEAGYSDNLSNKNEQAAPNGDYFHD